MPNEGKKEYFKILGVDNCSSENEIKRAYKKLALQFHPDKNSDFSGRKQFDEVSKAFETLTLEYRNDSYRADYDQVFFDFLLDILGWKEDAEGANTSNFFLYFCGSKQHLCSSDMDFDSRYQDTEEEEDIDGESDIDSIMEIIKNRRKKGKPVPEEFKEETLLDMKTKLNQHKEDMKKDACKKQASKKGKTPVPVAKPKPKSKKQLQAEQRWREKEMEKIAMELEEKRKEDEEKEKQRKQMEVEKQKRLEEERIKTQNEERKRREKEQKERERQQKLEQEREEKRRRQQEEEKKRKEEEEKRKKAEKEKADKEKAAKKAAQQAAKEKEDKEKAANKNQNMKRQQQQQRTDQQQYPREIPPRFQKKMKQKEQQQQQQQQQQTQFQPPQQQIQQQAFPQQTKVQPKPQPTVGKKKDPNRFASKEFADIIEPMDDSGWTQGAPAKGSGWGNSLETWEDADKWGAEDRLWGNKEGTWDKLIVDEGDRETWPTVGSKGTIGDKLKTSSDAGSEKGQYSTESSPKTSVSSLSGAVKPDNAGTTAQSNVVSNVDKKSLPSSHWSGVYPTPTENWDVIDESIDRAIDAADAAATGKDNVGLAAGWGGVAKGGLGGIIGTSLNWESSLNTEDSTSTVQSNESGKGELVNNSNVSETAGWSKTPGKGFKPKVPTISTAGSNNMTASWGGTPAESDTKWTEPNSSADGVSTSKETKPPKLESNSLAKSGVTGNSEQNVTQSTGNKMTVATGWGDVPTTGSSSWGASADITGTSCWDSVTQKSDSSDLKASSNSKVSQWLESTPVSLGDLEWGQDSVEHDEGSEGSLDGWTTASKRNRAPKPANDSNAWMNRSLKQLLDMGFKQEDAEKALKANHMNIESAIGDLLAMNMSESRDQMSAVTAEPDPAEAARIQQQQQQNQSKLNRKQRRKLQQQQQAEQQTLVGKPDIKQAPTELSVSKTLSQSSETLPKPTSEQLNKAPDATQVSKTETSQEDSNTKQTAAPTSKSDKPVQAVSGTSKPVNGQAQLSGNSKRAGPPLIPSAPGPGVQGPLRPPLAHPLLHPQFVQQLHLQQLRMAQGGLLQPPFTPQQFAMLQQIAQLQLVHQRLTAQSVAQQHMGQKQQVVPQQQLYQQQQQIALMIAQMQQQVLQQQPGLAGRHPALQFTTVQQSLAQQQQQQPSPTSQQKGNKPVTNEKVVSESPQAKTTETVKSQSNEPPSVPPVTTEEHTKQPSPVPQSRLTQWKQPLLQDPAVTSTQPPVTSSTPTLVDSKPQPVSTSSQSASSLLPSVVSAPSVSTSEGSDLSAPNSNNVSPRTRIPDPVSSRWGVDAGPKLSADPPEFKPGVPWRPRNEKREEGRDVSSSSAAEISSRPSSSSSDSHSDSWTTTGNQTVSAPNSVPSTSSVKAADDTVNTTANSGFTALSINSNTFESNQVDIGLNSTPWQTTDSKAPVSPLQGANKPSSIVASLLRPPPGLGTETALPESPLFDDEPPPWLKSLIETGFTGDKAQPEFQFSRFGFANISAPWSPRDAETQPFSPLTPNPQPWAAVGGPIPTLSSSASTVPLATNENARSVSTGSAGEPPNLQNSGIIWSNNQPIPSAEEKLTGIHAVASVPTVSASGTVAPSRSTANSMSTWLVLCNLSPRMDPKTLRPLCERHGPLLTFQLNLRHGNSLIRYGSMDEAAKARAALNGLMLNGTQVGADFATDSDIGSFFEQTMDWSANPFPSNTYGNQWSFQNMLGSSAANDGIQTASKAPLKNPASAAPSEQPSPKVTNPAPGMQWGAAVGPMPPQGIPGAEQSKVNAPAVQWGSGLQGSEQPGPKPNNASPSIPWGSAPGAAPAPSYLWGSGPSQQVLGGNFSQVPSMWSFPAGIPRDAEPQSGSGDGLVSPSMTTFLPPGLLNGGGDSV